MARIFNSFNRIKWQLARSTKILLDATGTVLSTALQTAKTADTASATVLAVPKTGNLCVVTGTTQIDHITKTDWQAGSWFILQTSGALQLTHNAGSVPATAAAMKIAGAANITTAAGDRFFVYFDGTDFQVQPIGIVAGLPTASLAASSVTKAKAKVFFSTEQTGSGSSQNVAHGLGATPAGVIIAVTELPDAAAETGFDVAEGAHDGTNVVVTVTNTVKYKVFAWA